jgi:pyruvate dehydrogenase E2 component (dihydrolipoamide acetyltransferase)
MAKQEVHVPDLGDADEVEVIELCLKPGESLEENDPLIVIESDKASMDVPAPFAGKLVKFEVAVGDSVKSGQLIAVIEPVSGGAAERAADKADKDAKAASQNVEAKSPDPEDAEPEHAEPEHAEAKDADQKDDSRSGGASDESSDRSTGPRSDKRSGDKRPSAGQLTAGPGADVYAGPAVRKLARELGVDLQQVRGTANGGRITKEDVNAHVKQAMTQGHAGGIAMPLPDFEQFGEIDSEPMSKIRQRGADNLSQAWRMIPHVTQTDEFDVTDLEDFRQGLKAEAEQQGVKLTLLPLLIKAVVAALQAYPRFNASLSEDGRTLILKRYYHMGLAVDTDQGLVVPVVRDADQKGIWELAGEMAELAERARARKLRSEDLQGASFTVSSLGPIGGLGFTPIINPPEVAILGVSKLQTRPLWDGESFAPARMLPLSLSYDHRVINGAEAGRFLVYLGQCLTDLRNTLL